MTNPTRKARRKSERDLMRRALDAVLLLLVQGFLTDAERERVHVRMMKRFNPTLVVLPRVGSRRKKGKK